MPHAASTMPQGTKEKGSALLTEEKKTLLRKTWAIASQPSVQAGNKLFKTLFQIAPSASTYFSSTDIDADDFQRHIQLVMGTLGTAIDNLDDLSVIVPGLQGLGATHDSLGVRIEYFKYVKQALLQTLSQELQDAFTDDCREAWTLAFDVIVGAMISGMSNM
ncbi:neuroglobin [Exaiptasia diaphana]|uniref:Globin-like protein n=1 Tax=Exaiptasia diaphana TaxID=2652724 RepID=A0A2K9UYQ6_EXADI|nr:neuroglobin [Exaiptasia diaphana]AUV50089.1 globin-like protein [Exaiptasia diaphana]